MRNTLIGLTFSRCFLLRRVSLVTICATSTRFLTLPPHSTSNISKLPYGSLFNQPYRRPYEPEGDTSLAIDDFSVRGGYLIGDRLLPPAPALCNYWVERLCYSARIDYRLGFSALNQAVRTLYTVGARLASAFGFCVNSVKRMVSTPTLL